MGHVANVVGGVKQVNLFYGDADQRFFPNPREYQEAAVEFLAEHAFSTPAPFLDPDIVLRLTPRGVAARVLAARVALLETLLSEERIRRMSEHAGSGEDDVYAPSELLSDVRSAIFPGPASDNSEFDLHRRNLQRALVDLLAGRLEDPSTDSDLPALARRELSGILNAIQERSSTGNDSVTAAHHADLAARIKKALKTDE